MKRALEILPGLLVWLTLILPFAFSYRHPYGVAVFVIFYTLLWVSRSLLFSYYLLFSFRMARRHMTVSWREFADAFDAPDFGERLARAIPEAQAALGPLYARYRHIPAGARQRPAQMHHLVVLPTYKEDLEVLRHSLLALQASHYDLARVMVTLATEERDAARAREYGHALTQEFGNVFGAFWVVEHPADLPDEIPCKGSNIHFAGREAAKRVQALKIDPKNVLVTTIDADNLLHPDYLACLTVHAVADARRKYRSFQSLPLFFNNIWQVPIFNRLVALTSSFWHMIQSGRANRLRNFAAHSQPLDALIEMDFWSKTSIVEDGHQFWRSYFHFNGDHRVIPLFMPIYQDAVQLDTYWETLKAQYLQLRRWAWGITDVPFTIMMFWKHRKTLPFFRTLRRVWVLFEGHYMWATAPIIIMMSAHLPQAMNETFRESVQAYNLSFLLSYFFRVALVGLFVSLLVAVRMMPRPPSGLKGWISGFFMWLLFPLTTVIFGAVPALDSQTRLMLGQRLDFNVTKKVRKVVE